MEPAVDDCVADDELLDGPNVELAWLVEPPVDDCVAVWVDELCP